MKTGTEPKTEYPTLYLSNGDSDDDGPANFPGDPDTRFMKPKQNSNERFSYDHYCSTCEQTFRTAAELRNHKSHHTKEFYTCLKCLRKFRTLKSIQNHMPSHGRRFRCRKCDSSFELKSSLENHMFSHRNYTDDCNYEGCTCTFKSRAAYLDHTQYGHLPEKTIPCPICHRYYQTPISMMSHRTHVHGKIHELVEGYTME